MRLSMVLAGAVLAGCAGQQMAPIDPLAGDEACGAQEMQRLLGQPEAALAGMDGVQVLRPGQMAGAYQPARLSVTLNRQGQIARVSCG